jgi:hypothetical protein
MIATKYKDLERNVDSTAEARRRLESRVAAIFIYIKQYM